MIHFVLSLNSFRYPESAIRRYFSDWVFLKTPVLESFFKKASDLNACNFILKKVSNSVFLFSCEYCEIFKNSFFYRAPPVATIRSQRILLLNMWKLK